MLYTITNEEISKMIDRYLERDGYIYTIEGCLNDNYIITAAGCYTVIIKEKYLNEWSSCNVIKRYRKCPKKYEKVMELLDDDRQEEAEKLFFK